MSGCTTFARVTTANHEDWLIMEPIHRTFSPCAQRQRHILSIHIIRHPHRLIVYRPHRRRSINLRPLPRERPESPQRRRHVSRIHPRRFAHSRFDGQLQCSHVFDASYRLPLLAHVLGDSMVRSRMSDRTRERERWEREREREREREMGEREREREMGET